MISFDGAHDVRLWARSRAIAERADAHFTYFLSCATLIPRARASDYKAPGIKAGRSNIGFAQTVDEVGARLDNASFFGAPVGIFLSVDRRMGPPQWADLGIYLQTVMLLAVEQGLDTCPQEFWAFRSQPVARFLELPPERMLFAGIALGWRDESAPINQWRTERDPFDTWAEMRGF